LKDALRIGSRSSPLALVQANWVAGALRSLHPALQVAIVEVRTAAERFPDRPLADLSVEVGIGFFTKELDEALVRGEVDVAVHSLKDLPTEVHPKVALAAVPERESPLDAFVSPDRTPLRALPAGSKLGTSSPRRKAQVLALRPDLAVVPLRGNVDTRLRKLRDEGLAGTILAHAGLRRLGREGAMTEVLAPDVMVPAVGQGALAVCCRRDDIETITLLGRLDHAVSRSCVSAERNFLRRLRGGCQVPAGALASLTAGRICLLGVIALADGSRCVRGERSGAAADAEAVGAALAEDLLSRGGQEILGRLRGSEL
jgi:hydroxymethylbilane synthase